MGILSWAAKHWFDLLQSVGIIGSLLFTAFAVRKGEEARKIGNSIAINEQHREIWEQLYAHPELSRVMIKERSLEREPATEREELFVNTLIVHLSTAYRAMQRDEFVRLEGLEKDVKTFFALPIPKAVWKRVRPFHDKDFVEFIETLVK